MAKDYEKDLLKESRGNKVPVINPVNAVKNVLQNIFEKAPVALLILRGESFFIEFVNDFYLRLVGKKRENFADRLLWEGFPELKEQGFEELLKEVYKTGISFHSTERKIYVIKDGQEEVIYVNFSYQPLYSAAKEIDGIIVMATDVTKQVLARQKVEEREELLKSLVNNAPMATGLYVGSEMIIELANSEMLKLWGKDASVIGKTLREALPELEGQPFHDLLTKVYTTGTAYHADEDRANLIVNGVWQSFYFKFTYKPLEDSNGKIYGILNMAVDVTDQVKAKQELKESEEMLSFALDSAEMGTFDLDPVKMVFKSSHRLKELFGLPDEQDIDLDVAIATIHEKDRERVSEAIKWALNPTSNGIYDVEYTITSLRDGKEHVLSAKGKSYFNENNEAYRLSGTVQDVTDQVYTRKRIEESEHRLNMAMDFTNTGSFDLDITTGEIIYTKRLGEIFGYKDLTKISHKTMRKHVHYEDVKIVEKAFETALSTGDYHYEVRIVKNDGSVNWIATNGRVLYNEAHKPVRMIGTLRDITETKTEQDRKDEFMGIVTHELKTPVTSLKAFAQFLGKRFQKSGDKESASFLTKMEAQINKLNILIQDLLNVTKIDGGRLQFKETDFFINDLVKEVVEEVQRTTTTNIIIEEHSGEIALTSDKDRTGQIIVNLLSNAIKYSPNSNRVIISTKLEDKTVLCCVKDFGIGISKEKQANLFQRFYRVNTNNADTFPGLGLGLYISSEIAKRQNGRIVVDSETGKGSTFCLHLPANVS